jgi:hypothetical protein
MLFRIVNLLILFHGEANNLSHHLRAGIARDFQHAATGPHVPPAAVEQGARRAGLRRAGTRAPGSGGWACAAIPRRVQSPRDRRAR